MQSCSNSDSTGQSEMCSLLVHGVVLDACKGRCCGCYWGVVRAGLQQLHSTGHSKTHAHCAGCCCPQCMGQQAVAVLNARGQRDRQMWWLLSKCGACRAAAAPTATAALSCAQNVQAFALLDAWGCRLLPSSMHGVGATGRWGWLLSGCGACRAAAASTVPARTKLRASCAGCCPP